MFSTKKVHINNTKYRLIILLENELRIEIFVSLLKFEEIIEAFNEPAKYPFCSGSRNLSDNLSDLKAQIAANKKVW